MQYTNEFKSIRSLTREIVRDCMILIKMSKNRYDVNHEIGIDFEFEPYYCDKFINVFDSEIIVRCLLVRNNEAFYQVDASAGDEEPHIEIAIQVDPKYERRYYREIYMSLTDVVRHELEHIDQYSNRPEVLSTPELRDKINTVKKLKYKYFLLPEEIEAMCVGMYTRAKKEKTEVTPIYKRYLGYYLENGFITKYRFNQILNIWREYTRKRFPNAIL